MDWVKIDKAVYLCPETGQTYREHLIKLGIPAWKFYAAKQKYTQEAEEDGRLLQLNSSNATQISEYDNGYKDIAELLPNQWKDARLG